MRPKLQLTNAGKTALVGTSALSINNFLVGSSFDTNNAEIQDENPFELEIAFQKVYTKGQQYEKDGVTITEDYNHIKVMGYLSASDITFDETGEYTVREIALIGSINSNDIVIAYGYDEEGITLYENSEERQVIKLDIITEDTPNITVNNSTAFVNYGDFLDHKDDVLTANKPVHGLTYQNNRLYINNSPLTVDVDGVANTFLDSILGINVEVETLPAVSSYPAGYRVMDKATGAMFEVVDNSGTKSWKALEAINSRFSTIESAMWFPTRQNDTVYAVGDVVKHTSCTPFQYIECVVAGTSGSSNPVLANTGQLMTDGTAKWLVLDMRDSNPVGSIKHDLIVRTGYLVLNGQTINVVDYPRLVSFLSINSLIKAYTATPNTTEFTYGDSNNETLILPDFNNLFIESCLSTPYVLEKVNAGLPNITGTCGYIRSQKTDNSTVDRAINDNTKALKWGWKTTNAEEAIQNINDSTKAAMGDITLDASRSSSIYGNSSTVQPPAVKLLSIIKY